MLIQAIYMLPGAKAPQTQINLKVKVKVKLKVKVNPKKFKRNCFNQGVASVFTRSRTCKNQWGRFPKISIWAQLGWIGFDWVELGRLNRFELCWIDLNGWMVEVIELVKFVLVDWVDLVQLVKLDELVKLDDFVDFVRWLNLMNW